MVQADMPVEISALIPVLDRYDSPQDVWEAYRDMLVATGRSFEVIYVIDDPNSLAAALIGRIRAENPNVRMIRFNRSFGEAACLMEAARQATGSIFLVLPAYLQVEPRTIALLVDELGEADVATAVRDRRGDRTVHRIRAWIFRRVAAFAGSRFDDPGCAVRAVRSEVFEELLLQDEQHFFLPLLAEQKGFSVRQVELPQARGDRRFRLHRPSAYLGRMLDLIALGFLAAFIQKPFRFFGTIGASIFSVGLAIGIFVLIERQFFGVPVADRPLLLLTALLIVLGVQIGAVGLIAEIVIFTRTQSPSTYRIEKIVEREDEVWHETV